MDELLVKCSGLLERYYLPDEIVLALVSTVLEAAVKEISAIKNNFDLSDRAAGVREARDVLLERLRELK